MKPILPNIDTSEEVKYLPYPEVIDDGDWTITSGPGTAVRSKRGPGGEVAVPMTASDFDRARRIRALVAGRHSPQQWREVPEHIRPEMLMIAETMRIGALTRIGMRKEGHPLAEMIDGYVDDETGNWEHLGAVEVGSNLMGPFLNGDVSEYVKIAARESTLFQPMEYFEHVDQMANVRALQKTINNVKILKEHPPIKTEFNKAGDEFLIEANCYSCKTEWTDAKNKSKDLIARRIATDHEYHLENHVFKTDGDGDQMRAIYHQLSNVEGAMERMRGLLDRKFSIDNFINGLADAVRFSAELASKGKKSSYRGLDATDHRTSIRIAEILQELIEDHQRAAQRYGSTYDEKQSERDDPGETEVAVPGEEGVEGGGEAGDTDMELPPSISEEEYDRDVETGSDSIPDYEPASSDQDWGKMTIVELPLDRLMPARLTSPARRFSDRGVIPTAIHRWCSDKQIFATKRRANGGSVLIDVSGSMSLSTEEVYHMLETIPAGIIGIYSSRGGRGHLRIVAEGGRMIERGVNLDNGPAETRSSKIINYGGGNGVDGKALRWLAEQMFPRIWISDGIVTGEEEMHTKELLDDALDVCRNNRIIRVPSLDEAMTTVEKYS